MMCILQDTMPVRHLQGRIRERTQAHRMRVHIVERTRVHRMRVHSVERTQAPHMPPGSLVFIRVPLIQANPQFILQDLVTLVVVLFTILVRHMPPHTLVLTLVHHTLLRIQDFMPVRGHISSRDLTLDLMV